jgi:ATP-dependent protease HslVU (ClpYQ) peptidase subunit
MNAYFDINAVKSWYDTQTQTYQGKPSCLKVEFYQKVGTKVETRETKNFDGDDIRDLSNPQNLATACKRFTPEGGWAWLARTIDCFIPSGEERLMISYFTANGSAKSNFPISLNRKQDAMMTNFSNISGLSGTNGTNPNELVQKLIGMIQNGQGTATKTEAEMRAEILKDVSRDRRIEELEDTIEFLKEERLGGMQKIGQILESSPELARGVGSGINMLFGVLGEQIGKAVNGFQNANAKGQNMQRAAVGTLETNDKETIIITIDVALAAVKAQFSDQDPIVSIYKLAKVLEQNEMFKPTIQNMMQKIEL